MASSRKTLDVDIITLRQVNIRGPNNSYIPSSSVLLSDGRGGTYWSYVSTAGNYPSFNQIQINSNLYTASPTNQTFSLMAGDGIGFTDFGPGSYIYAKAFQTIQVPGLSTIYAFSNGVMNSNLRFSTSGALGLSTDTLHNTLWFRASLNTIQVLSNTSTVAADYAGVPAVNLPITAAVSSISFVGIGDVFIQANGPIVSFGVNGYTQQGYVDLSGRVFTLQSNILQEASTFYISKNDLSTSLQNLSTVDGLYISNVGFQYAFSNYNSFVVSSLSTASTLTQIDFSTLLFSTTAALSTLSTAQVFYPISTLSSYFYNVNRSTLSSVTGQLASTSVAFSTLFTSSIGQLFSTLSSFHGAISTIELLSTTSSLLLLLSSAVVSTNSTSFSYLSTMSTSMTTYFQKNFLPRVSLVSSIHHNGIIGDSVPFTYSLPSGGLGFVTAGFTLKDVIPCIRSARADVSIEYNPVLLFPMATTTLTQPQNLCTILLHNGFNVVPNLTYNDTISFSQASSDSNASAYFSNVYSKYVRIKLDTNFVLSNPNDNYSIYHYSPTLASHIYALGPGCNSTLHIRTPNTNSVYLNIFNVD